MMREVWYCDTCGAETGFHVNGHPYCQEHAMDGIGVQARLVASLAGGTGDEVARAGQWAVEETERMLRAFGSQP